MQFLMLVLNCLSPLTGQYAVHRTDYWGGCVYEDGALKRVLFPGGYASPNADGTCAYHFFQTDYQGNVRAVLSESGALEEANSYYPYGMLMPGDDGELPALQPYKYSGKEYVTIHGLNQYDFGPRPLYSPGGIFTSPDRHCEKTFGISPYVCCLSNPIAYSDPSGNDALLSLIDNAIVVKANIYIYGPDATNERAELYKKDIYDTWGKYNKYQDGKNTYDIEWDINVMVMQGGDNFDYNGENNYFSVDKSVNRSEVISCNHGKLRAEGRSCALSEDNPMSHEFGHLLGLDDKYNDIKSLDINFIEWSGDIMREPTSNPDRTISPQHFQLIFKPLIEKRNNIPRISTFQKINVFINHNSKKIIP